ncbi:MAG: hypothetical protein JO368_00380 [Acidimicrobiales bacterium]|nr:hypothetical protein [Acidimicrobiales bacterium]
MKSKNSLLTVLAVALVAVAAAGCAQGAAGGDATTTSSTTRSGGGAIPSSTGVSPTSTTIASGSNGDIYAMGQTVYNPPTADGVVSATVYGFYPNIQSTEPGVDHPPGGKTYGAIDVRECAGSSGAPTGANESDFTVLLSNGSTAGVPDSLVGNPSVSRLASEAQLGSNSQSLSAGKCARGWVVFDIPTGSTPAYVAFSGTSGSLTASAPPKWTIG